MKMDFAVGMGRNERMDEIGDHAKVAEESGFKYVSFVDQPYMSRDVLTMMTMAGTNTRRIHIGQGVTDPETYSPLAIANAAASLSELTGGRAFVGIGAGGPFGKIMEPVSLPVLRRAVEFIQKFTAGEEVEYKGAKIRSEYSKHQVPVYMAAAGPKSLQMLGEIADGAILVSGPSTVLKWRIEQIEKGAIKVGRDPSKIDIWVRAMIYVADSQKEALKEVGAFALNHAVRTMWLLRQKGPEIEDLRKRLEREHPGLLDEYQRVYNAWDPKWHEHVDAPAARLVTPRMVDLIHLAGTVDDICEKIHLRQKAGVKVIATATYTIVDKKGMMREIGDKIMPHFRN